VHQFEESHKSLGNVMQLLEYGPSTRTTACVGRVAVLFPDLLHSCLSKCPESELNHGMCVEFKWLGRLAALKIRRWKMAWLFVPDRS